ncbi:hypothetical protein EPN90_02530 [Patescibacteria group bacterium]|nr:MAG: hypothetical protein EPN90_02530 [Patescibacteria group bacterium]
MTKSPSQHLRGVIKDLWFVLAPPTVVLVLHILRQLIWPLWIELDMLAHLLGGLTIAWAAGNFYLVLRRRRALSALPRAFYVYYLLSAVALIGVLWEIQEWIVFHTIVTLPPGITDVWTDTISDLTLDLFGGLIWFLIDSRRGKKS